MSPTTLSVNPPVAADAALADRRRDLMRALQLLGVLVLANLVGWFVFFRVEAATMLAGAGMFALHARPDTRDHQGAWLRLIGCALFCAGAFDYLDIAAESWLGDWFSGALTGSLLLLPSWLFGWVTGDRRLRQLPIGVHRLTACFSATALAFPLIAHSPFGDLEISHWTWALAALMSAGIQWAGRRTIKRWIVVMDVLALQCCVMAFDRLLAGNLVGIAWGVTGAALAALSDRRVDAAGPQASMPAIAIRAFAWFGSLWFGLIAAFGSLANDSVSSMIAMHDVFMPLSEREFGNLALRDVYLWPEEIRKDVDPDRAGVKGFSLRHAAKDRFSGQLSATADARRDRYYGLDSVRIDGSKVVAYVSPYCVPASSGFKRGYLDIGFIDDDDSRHFGYRSLDEQEEALHENVVSFAVPKQNCVRLETRIFEWSGRRVGYLYYPRFEPMFDEELRTRFAELQREGIEELILDLRYNPGGKLTLTRSLAGLIAGERAADKPLLTTRYPDRYRDARRSVELIRMPTHPLGLQSLIVLTTQRTCSASEALINGLRPFMEVVTIGGRTCGKPVGFAPLHYKDSVFHIAEFEVVNSRGQGGYFNGIEATCSVEEDFRADTRTMGDPLLRVARYFVHSHRCQDALEAVAPG